ncbi:hypothetical protein [Streptomyces griseosporeus]|uniref:hypothetical protein n=1 Tax=Streptomyces griseosporeus TaxID=1910 RepID=UPI0036F6B925
MSTPPARPAPPLPECAPAQIGPCANCQQPCHRYGHGASPLCVLCQQDLEEWRAQVAASKA